MKGNSILLEVRDLRKHFPIRGGVLSRVVASVKAVDGVSFAIHRGEVLGLVGESGSGKTTVGRTFSGSLSPRGAGFSLTGRRSRGFPGTL